IARGLLPRPRSSLLLLFRQNAQLLEVVVRAERVEARIGPQPLYWLEAFCNRLPEVSKCLVRLLQLSKGNASQIPALGPIGPMLNDIPEVRCGFVPLRELEVGVPTVPPVRVHVASQLNCPGKIGNGFVPLLPIEVKKRPSGPRLPGIRLHLGGFRI